jgi:hypothetical protein
LRNVLRASPYPLAPAACAGTRRVFCFIPSRAARRGEGLVPGEVVAESARLSFQERSAKPLAQGLLTRCYPLADVSRISGTGRFGGTRTAKDEHTNCTRLCPFTQGFSVCQLNLSMCKFSSLRGDASWKKKLMSGSSSSESQADLRAQIVISNANADQIRIGIRM